MLRAAWGAAPRHVHPCGPAPGPQTGTSSRSTAIAGMIGQDEVIAEWAALIQPLEKGGAGTAQGEGLEDGGRVGALPPARHAQDCGEHQELGGGRRRLPLSRNQRCRHPRPRPPALRPSEPGGVRFPSLTPLSADLPSAAQDTDEPASRTQLRHCHGHSRAPRSCQGLPCSPDTAGDPPPGTLSALPCLALTPLFPAAPGHPSLPRPPAHGQGPGSRHQPTGSAGPRDPQGFGP